MISLQKIITKLKSLIDKNTADITALNNDLSKKLNTADELFRYFEPSTDNDNANWAILPGMYRTTSSTIGASAYGILVVFAAPYPTAGFNGKNWIHQLWFTNDNVVYHRYSMNKTDGGGWTEWTTL